MLPPQFVIELEEWLEDALNTPVVPPVVGSFLTEPTDPEDVSEEMPEEWDETVRVAEEWLINHPMYTVQGVRMNLDGNE